MSVGCLYRLLSIAQTIVSFTAIGGAEQRVLTYVDENSNLHIQEEKR
jgi:hypothetical protein